MLIYLTYAEPPSGVYSSQVTDVIRFINHRLQGKIRLVAFISLHDFSATKAKIKAELHDAIVLPALPKARYWQLNAFVLGLLCLVLRPTAIMARNVIAANMALGVRKFTGVKRVCFDGRGAIAAEWHEYDVTVTDSWKKNIHTLEAHAVRQADFRIAVTQQLVEYWRERYGYTDNRHVVIPCTLNSNFKAHIADEHKKITARTALGLSAADLVLAYSGSIAGWQSFPSLYACLGPFLRVAQHHKIVFLAKEEEYITRLEKEFPGQVIRKWVGHHEVPSVLAACDMGILLRDSSVTNRVASPTKFAEYLAAGLPVLISEAVGDYSAFVKDHGCGIIADETDLSAITPATAETRSRMVGLVNRYFTKEAQLQQYQTLLQHLH